MERIISWLKRLFFPKPKPEPVVMQPVVKEQPVRYVKVKLGNEIIDAEIIKENLQTILVRLSNNKIVKRHKEKHVVSL